MRQDSRHLLIEMLGVTLWVAVKSHEILAGTGRGMPRIVICAAGVGHRVQFLVGGPCVQMHPLEQ